MSLRYPPPHTGTALRGAGSRVGETPLLRAKARMSRSAKWGAGSLELEVRGVERDVYASESFRIGRDPGEQSAPRTIAEGRKTHGGEGWQRLWPGLSRDGRSHMRGGPWP